MNQIVGSSVLSVVIALLWSVTGFAGTGVYIDSHDSGQTRVNIDEYLEESTTPPPAQSPRPPQAPVVKAPPAATAKPVGPRPKRVNFYLIFRYMAGSMEIEEHELEIDSFFSLTGLSQQTIKLDNAKENGNSYSLAFGIMQKLPGPLKFFRPEFEIMVNSYTTAFQNSGYYDFKLRNGSTEKRKVSTSIEFDSSAIGLINLWFDIPLGLRIKPYIGGSVGGGLVSYDYNLDIVGGSANVSETLRSDNAFILFAGVGGGVYTVLFDRIMLDCYARYLWSDSRDVDFESDNFSSYNPTFQAPIKGFGLSLGLVF